MPYKRPEFRDAPQLITVQRALYLIAEQELARQQQAELALAGQQSQFDLERIGAALVQNL
jgi:hypothetical protein